VVLRGQYIFHIRDLHTQYGPIIRINPYELHVSDSTFYDTLYASSASGERRDKWEWYTKQFGLPEAMFSTISHDQHKLRRAALNRFFSMTSVRRLQPVIEERVAKLLERLLSFKDVEGSDGVIKVNYAYAAFTNGQFGSF
jgi:cytochrome P450